MNSWKQIWPGVLAGVVTSTLLTFALTPPRREAPKAPDAQSQPVKVIEREVIKSADLQALLRAQAAAAEPPEKSGQDELPEAEEDPSDIATPDPGPTPQETLALLNEDYQKQEVDPVWAPKAEQTLSVDLDKYAEDLGFSLSRVECRGDACKATVEFPDYASAREQMMHLTGRGYSVPCATGVSIPPPEDVNQPYQLQLFLLECKKDQS